MFEFLVIASSQTKTPLFSLHLFFRLSSAEWQRLWTGSSYEMRLRSVSTILSVRCSAPIDVGHCATITDGAGHPRRGRAGETNTREERVYSQASSLCVQPASSGSQAIAIVRLRYQKMTWEGGNECWCSERTNVRSITFINAALVKWSVFDTAKTV